MELEKIPKTSVVIFFPKSAKMMIRIQGTEAQFLQLLHESQR